MKTYLVTGANRGIGLEFCKQLITAGLKVIAVCREPSDELKALNLTIESGVDVTDEKAILALSERLKNISIDVLINNAGILRYETLDDMNFAQISQQFEVNAIAPLRFTLAFLPNLHAGSKVIFITSRMGSIEDIIPLVHAMAIVCLKSR